MFKPIRLLIALAALVAFLVALPTSDAADKIKFDKKKLRAAQVVDAPALDIPMMLKLVAPERITILGDPTVTQAQMVNLINKRNPKPLLNCSVRELVQIYYEEAGREGIRADVALCQALKETGFFAYGGDVNPKQNNYCGLGATGNKEPGAVFETPRMGARAHVQHLLAYTSVRKPNIEVVDPRYELIKKFRPQIFGKIKTWTGLNGVWAVPGNRYGHEILQLWQQALTPDASDESFEAAEFKISFDDDKASAYNERGLVYFARKDYRKAQEDFQKALEINPNLTEVLFNSAITFEKMNRPDDAIKTYDKYLQIDSKTDSAYYNRGRLKLAKKLYEDAINDFRAALEIEDRFVDAHNEIAIALFRRKKYSEALEEIQKAAEVNTTNKIISDNKTKLEDCVKKQSGEK